MQLHLLLLFTLIPLSSCMPPLFQSICPSGTEPSSLTSLTPICIPCHKDHFSSILTSFTCKPCPPNTHTVGTGNEFCLPRGSVICPHPYWLDKQGACKQCDTTSRFDPDAKACIPCSKGEYSFGGDAKDCFICGEEQSYLEEFVRCACPAGKITRGTKCEPCKKGTYRNGMMDLEVCRECPMGTYANKIGETRCKRCPRGYSTPWIGAKECLTMEKVERILKEGKSKTPYERDDIGKALTKEPGL